MGLGAIDIDDPTGNNDGIIDPGETVDVVVGLTNQGAYDAENVTGVYSTSNAYTTINSGNLSFGTIAPGATETASFNISVSTGTPIAHVIEGILDVNCLSNGNSFDYDYDLNLSVGLLVEDFETGDFTEFEWENSGNSDWFITTDEAYEGTYSTRSGAIGNNSSSNLQITVNVLSAGDLSFYRKVSSENTYDFLRFYVDGAVVESWSGEEDWAQFTHALSVGEHTLKWAYEKDTGVANGSDCAWIDYVVFPGIQHAVGTPEFSTLIQLYPNPVSNYLFVKGIEKETAVQIIDVKGSITRNIPKFNGTYIDVSELDTGVYFIRFTKADRVEVRKIIVK